MGIENHPRYRKFIITDTVHNDCDITNNEMSFVIFYNDFKLRGHTVHFITPSEFGLGFQYYSSFTSSDIKQLRNKLIQIKCPYTKKSNISKSYCCKCQKIMQCSNIINDKVLEEYVDIVSKILVSILSKPRFSITKQNRGNQRMAKMLIGLCDEKIIVKSELMDDRATYNVVTTYVPDSFKRGNDLSAIIDDTVREITSRHINSQALFCTDRKWDMF